MKSYAEREDIEQIVLNLIRYYIGKMFNTYGNLKYKGIQKDDIESDVCFYIFKTNKKGETFLDRMSEIKTLKHLRAFVKRCVINQLNARIRDVDNGPVFVELDYKITSDFSVDFDSNDFDNYRVISDPNANTERSALISTAINSIKIDTYNSYLYEYEKGKFKVLDTEDLFWMIEHKKSVTVMAEAVISKKTGRCVQKATLQNLILGERVKLMKALENNLDRFEMFK